MIVILVAFLGYNIFSRSIRKDQETEVTFRAARLQIVLAVIFILVGLRQVELGRASAASLTRMPDILFSGRSQPPQPVFEIGAGALEDIYFERLGLEAGLSDGTVNCIMQDRQGFLWFGTENGLNRYDGYEFRVFRPDPEDPGSLSDSWVNTIYQDSLGIIWIGTRYGGLNRFDPASGKFSHYLNDPDDPKTLVSNRVQAIIEDQRGKLWIGTDRGLDLFYTNTGDFKHYFNATYLLDEPIGENITVIAEDMNGFLWIGTRDSGLKRFNPLQESFITFRNDPDDPYSLSDNHVTAIAVDKNGTTWIGTRNGLNLYDPQAGMYGRVFYRYWSSSVRVNSVSDDHILSLYLDNESDLWVGTNKGIDRFDRTTRSFINYRHEPRSESSLSYDVVTAIFQDKGDVLWVGTGGAGLNKYVRAQEQFYNYQHQDENPFSLSGNSISSIYVDQRGHIWIGTVGAGLNRMDPLTGQVLHFRYSQSNTNYLSDDDIWAITKDPSGYLWLGTSAGLDRFDLSRGIFTRYQHQPSEENSLVGAPVNAILISKYGYFWVGTAQGLDRFYPEEGRFEHFSYNPADPNSLSDNQVTALFEDEEGNLWVGTAEGGLNKFDMVHQNFIRFQHDPTNPYSLDNNTVLAIYQDSRGILWIGTAGGGLNRYLPGSGTFDNFSDDDGLPNNVINGILEDPLGNLWLSTNYGISRLDPIGRTVINFNVADGLQGNEFNPNAYALGSAGEMYFGGINGLTVFDPTHINADDYIPPVVLTSLTQDSEAIQLETAVEALQEIAIRWPQNYFEFEFTALSYAKPAQNHYAYLLENYDTDWYFAGTQRFGRYSSLPGGTYTLRLRASNQDGVWNEDGIAIRITVIPPFWQTNWFRFSLALFFGLIILIVYRLSLKGVENRSKELEILVDERTQDLKKYTEELEALYSADEKMLRTQTLGHVFQTLLTVAVELLHADYCAVFVWDEDHRDLIPNVCWGYKEETLQVFRAHLKDLLDSENGQDDRTISKAYIVADILAERNNPIKAALLEEGVSAYMFVPILVENDLIGVFNTSFNSYDGLTEDTTRLLSALAQRASLSLENAQLFQRTKDVAILEERNRLARDLHDSAKQKAFAALAQIGAASGILKTKPAAVGSHLTEAENLVYEVIQELTFLIQEMYPMALKEKGLASTLRDYIFEWENRNDVDVDLVIENESKMALDREQTIYRIVQEALANVARHSKATHASVHLCYHEDEVEVLIEDNGCGFELDQKPSGMGLRSMRERIESKNGQLFIESASGEGTRLRVILLMKDETGAPKII